jgi:hypothetical protein
VSRLLYHREWRRKHPGYKAAQARIRAIFKPSRRAFYRELLGIRVRVNLMGTLCLRYNAAQRLLNGDEQ